MVLEIALCIALQSEDLEREGMLKGGVLTPATAFGPVLVNRLQKAGLKWEIVDGQDGGRDG